MSSKLNKKAFALGIIIGTIQVIILRIIPFILFGLL